MIWTVGLVNLGQTEPPALTPAQQEKFNRTTDLLPSCWSQEVSECVRGVNSNYPNCAELNALYNENDPVLYQALKGYVDAMPYCPSPAPAPKISAPLLIGIGFTTAMLLAVIVR
jgi:hypothetical protein